MTRGDLAPPQVEPVPTEQDELQALIEEARQRARRRRLSYAAVSTLAVLLAGVLFVFFGGGGGHSAASSRAPKKAPGRAVAASEGQETVSQLTAGQLQTLSFLGPRTGYGFFQANGNATCVDEVAKTTDGGAHFSSLVRVTTFGCGGNDPVTMLTFDAHGDGFLYGPLLFLTHDGGRSWTRDHVPSPVVAVSAIGQSVWMVEAVCSGRVVDGLGSCPLRLLESSNGGGTWTPSSSQPLGAIASSGSAEEPAQGASWLVRVSTSAAYLLAGPKVTAGVRSPVEVPLWYTDNGGASWTRRHIDCGKSAALSVALSAAPDGALVAVCASEPGAGFQPKFSSVSINGGRTWSVHGTCIALGACRGNNPPNDGYLGNVDAVSANTAYLIGERSVLLVTHDGGRNWQAEPTVNDTAGGPAQVIFFGPDDGVALAQTNAIDIWHTSNAGKTWTAVTPTVS